MEWKAYCDLPLKLSNAIKAMAWWSHHFLTPFPSLHYWINKSVEKNTTEKKTNPLIQPYYLKSMSGMCERLCVEEKLCG